MSKRQKLSAEGFLGRSAKDLLVLKSFSLIV